MGLEEARAVESAKGLPWKVDEFERYFLQASEVEVVVTHAEIPRYSHYGVRGRLILVFENDLLTKTIFYPIRLEEYLDEYEKHEGANLRDTGSGYKRGNTLIRLWARPGEESIVWVDDRLADYFAPAD